jgi:DNA-directed RNA polymerase specialized sigma24 family protein
LKTLDRAERHVLMLFYAEELNTTEIALVLDMPEPAVQETLEDIQSRARIALAHAAV